MSLYEVYMGGVKVNMGVYMGERMGCFGGENGGAEGRMAVDGKEGIE